MNKIDSSITSFSYLSDTLVEIDMFRMARECATMTNRKHYIKLYECNCLWLGRVKLETHSH